MSYTLAYWAVAAFYLFAIVRQVIKIKRKGKPAPTLRIPWRIRWIFWRHFFTKDMQAIKAEFATLSDEDQDLLMRYAGCKMDPEDE